LIGRGARLDIDTHNFCLQMKAFQSIVRCHPDVLKWRQFGTPLGLATELAFDACVDLLLDLAEERLSEDPTGPHPEAEK
jgi:hypothetical protein